MSQQKKFNIVEKPEHYNYGDLEVIDAIEAITAQFPPSIRYHVGNLVKYVARAEHKNGVEDLKKADWYLRRTNSQPILESLTVAPVFYTVDIKSFISAVVDSYPQRLKCYVNSFMYTLAYCESDNKFVSEVVKELRHDLGLLIEKY